MVRHWEVAVLAIAGAVPCAAIPLGSRMTPLFECNAGQLDGRVSSVVRARGLQVYAERNGITFALDEPGERVAGGPRRRYVLSATFAEGSGRPPVVETPAPTTLSYFRGRPEEWRTGISTAHALRYTDVWPGIDVLLEVTVDRLKYTFVVAPGADPALARLAYAGGRPMPVDEEIWVETPFGPLRDGAPIAWQETSRGRIDVAVRYLADGDEVGFQTGCFDPTLPLVIDPAVIVYAGFIGGAGRDDVMGITVDGSGATYLAGGTDSTELSFPVSVGPDISQNGWHDAFVAKVNPAGTSLVYAGFIGGRESEYATGIAVDALGAVYLSGTSDSWDFPTLVGPDLSRNSSRDAFVTKVAPGGAALQYSGYIGGASDDHGRAIAVDATGRAVVGGFTYSRETSFPVVAAADPTYNGSQDAFVARVKADGTGLDLCTYLGGSGLDDASGVAVGPQQQVVACGATRSDASTFPAIVGPDLTLGGPEDGWIASFDGVTGQIAYCGYVGGTSADEASRCAVDGLGRAYVTGSTESPDFPRVLGPDLGHNGGFDAFIVRISASGASFDYAGFLGGSDYDVGAGVSVDGSDRAVVIGSTGSDQGSFPVVDGPDLTHNGGMDAFVARIAADGSVVDTCGYIGGTQDDWALEGVVDVSGNFYVSGSTRSTESTFPIAVGPDLTYGGNVDGFVAKVSTSCAGILVSPQTLPLAALGRSYAQTLFATGGASPYTFSQAGGSLPPALSLSPAGVISGTVSAVGRYPFTVRATDAAGCEALKGYVLSVKVRSDIIVAPGEAPGNPNRVRVFDPDGVATATDFLAYASGTFGTTVGGGEIDGAGISRILTGPGPGPTLGPQVRAFQANGTALAKVNFYAYGSLVYGVNVASGDVDGEGIDEILTGAGAGPVFGPHVRGWDYDGIAVAAIVKLNFFAYGTLKYGVHVAAGDLERDGYSEIVTGPGPGAAFAPNARGFDYDGQQVVPIATLSFNPFPYAGYGVRAALGDVDADSRDEMAFTPGPGPSHPARVRGSNHDGVRPSPLPGFDVTPYPTLFGARASLGRLAPNVSPRLELVVAPGPDPAAAASLVGYRYSGIALIPLPWSFTAFPTSYGANVACAALGL